MAKKKYKILLVEDDLDQILMYRTQLELDGFKVFDAKKYEDVETIIKNEKPDIVLLDLILGAEMGENILMKLQLKKLTDKIPVFIFSNLELGKDEERILSLGAKGFWLKTKYYPRQLSEMIRNYLK